MFCRQLQTNAAGKATPSSGRRQPRYPAAWAQPKRGGKGLYFGDYDDFGDVGDIGDVGDVGDTDDDVDVNKYDNTARTEHELSLKEGE